MIWLIQSRLLPWRRRASFRISMPTTLFMLSCGPLRVPLSQWRRSNICRQSSSQSSVWADAEFAGIRTNFKLNYRKMRKCAPSTKAKLIVSLNRAEEIASSSENIDLLIEFRRRHPTIVCGVDLSGNPACKRFKQFEPLLERAKHEGIPLALHCGEIDDAEEIEAMLAFGMRRLGHGTFVKGGKRTGWLFRTVVNAYVAGANEVRLLGNRQITLECCLTSNLMCETVADFADHHFKRFFDNGHPVVICVGFPRRFSQKLADNVCSPSLLADRRQRRVQHEPNARTFDCFANFCADSRGRNRIKRNSGEKLVRERRREASASKSALRVQSTSRSHFGMNNESL